MDRLVYTAATGARHTMEQQATVSNNLANATTTGFRAQLDTFRAVPVVSEGLPTRVFVVDSTVGSDFRSGPIETTGRFRGLHPQRQPESHRERHPANHQRADRDR
jgi:flagellar basal-body rod protein FlgF